MVIYKMHDYDLMEYDASLRNKNLGNAKISFAGVMKGILENYVRGTPFKVPQIKQYSDDKLCSKRYIRFTLDEKTDADIIKVLDSVKSRQINSFLKNLLRRYLEIDGMRCYFETIIPIHNANQNNTNTITTTNKKIKKSPQMPLKIKKLNSYKKEEESNDVHAEILGDSPPVATEFSTNNSLDESSDFDFFGALGDINNL